ncbi:MAG TPA: nitroreductase family protein [Chthoniobacterales bacterium]
MAFSLFQKRIGSLADLLGLAPSREPASGRAGFRARGACLEKNKNRPRRGRSISTSHSFDTGAAWQNLALQAHLLGWGTRAIGGYDREKARIALRVPEDFALEAAVAIGRPGDKSLLSAEFQDREIPSGRQSLKELVIEGGFANA